MKQDPGAWGGGALACLFVVATLASGIYGFAFFPEPHSMWITRIFFGIVFLVGPALALAIAWVAGLAAAAIAGVAALAWLVWLVICALTSRTPW